MVQIPWRGPASAILLALAVIGVGACVDPPGGGSNNPPAKPINSDPLTTALPVEVRRLSQTEIDRTLRDVLLEPSAAGSRLLTNDTFTPYDNNYLEQQSSAALVDALDALAADVATRVLADEVSRAAVIVCDPADSNDDACFRTIVATVGKRLLRRPLSADEVETYLPLLAYANEDNAHYETDFDDAVEVLLRAFLMDPEFLFRVEVGSPTGEPGVRRLNAYETASRMSYLLWGSAPDDAVLAAADDGRLDDADARAALATTMLEDDRAKSQLERFHAMWLGYRAIPVPASLSSRFNTETNALIDRVVFEEKRDYLDVFTLSETFLDDELADHYGLPRPTTSPGWVSTAGTERGGILSQGSVLASFSKFTDTSPTQRGILVQNRLLCLPIEPPPPNANADQPPPAEGDAVCKIDRYLAHTASTSCNACHSQMDPIGFGLEGYDIQGRFRTHDDDNVDCVIDGSGALPGFGTFRGPKELSQLLVDKELVGPCFMEQLTSFSAGRPLSIDELSVSEAWHERFVQDGRRLDTLLLDMVSGEQFVTKRDVDVEDQP